MLSKKTVIISNFDSIKNPHYGGGGALATHEIAKRLVKTHNVKVICSAYIGSKDKIVDGVEYKHIGLSRTGAKTSQIIFSIILPFYAIKEKYDLWVENFSPPHSTNLIPLFTKKPVIGITSLLHAKHFDKKYHLPFSLVEKFGLKTYSYIIALNKTLRDKILDSNSKAKVKVIPRGISKNLLSLGGQEENYVLFLGRLDIYQKGLDMLLEVWSKVTRNVKGLKLVIAGDGSDKDRKTISKLVNFYGLNEEVILAGKILGKQKERIISKCLLLISPSRFEGFGNTALEALAAGKPVICFDIGGYSWIPDSFCIKIKPFELVEMEKAILKLAKDKKLRHELKVNAKSFSRQYSWENVFEQYRQFFDEVISQNQDSKLLEISVSSKKLQADG